jgi:diaminohydroxyphosphoribosylaminopyrimidine deaminase/5-amino-6-(5-phosphoribosylamino)uracil reductase
MTGEDAMGLALGQARRGQGRTFPNPSVGAVVFRGDRVLGRGATRPPGGPHAEVVALEAARARFGPRSLRGADMAVTLEPCCFTGRTGPCTRAIVEAGIRRIHIGCRDPHVRVDGRGLRALRRAGVEVELGVCEAACREHHRGFISVCERGRPFVTLKLASTLDGRIATADGESRWITGPEARRVIHRMRARSDAVMVGSGTALADDPELTARRGDRVLHRPVRLLVDSRLRVKPAARLYRGPDAGERTWVLCREGARGRRAIAATGARIFELPAARPGGDGHLDLAAGMQALAEAGLTSVLVEGGGGLAAALLRSRLVDEIHWMLAPSLLGGDGRPALAELGIASLGEIVRLESLGTRRLGADLHLWGRVVPDPPPGRGRRGSRGSGASRR